MGKVRKQYKVSDPHITRFLKEMNAFNLWKTYVIKDVDSFFRVHRRINGELNYNFIDSIFGKCNFTDYIKASGYNDLDLGEDLISELFKWFMYLVFQDYVLSEEGEQFTYLVELRLPSFIKDIVKRCGVDVKNIKWDELEDMVGGFRYKLRNNKWPTDN